MKHYYFSLLCLLAAGVGACRQHDVSSDVSPQVLKAFLWEDSTANVAIDQTVGVITLMLPTYKASRLRTSRSTLRFQTTPNASLASLEDTSYTINLLKNGLTFNVIEYNNSTPKHILIKDQTKQKQYQLQLRPAGPVRFESVPRLKDTLSVEFGYHQNYLIRLPVSNLFDGNPSLVEVYATLKDQSTSIKLEVLNDEWSQDMVSFYFDKGATRSGFYTIELRKNGQKAISPTVVNIRN